MADFALMRLGARPPFGPSYRLKLISKPMAISGFSKEHVHAWDFHRANSYIDP